MITKFTIFILTEKTKLIRELSTAAGRISWRPLIYMQQRLPFAFHRICVVRILQLDSGHNQFIIVHPEIESILL